VLFTWPLGQFCVGQVEWRPAANGIGIGISISHSIGISPAISLLRRGLFEANELPWQLGRESAPPAAGELALGFPFIFYCHEL